MRLFHTHLLRDYRSAAFVSINKKYLCYFHFSLAVPSCFSIAKYCPPLWSDLCPRIRVRTFVRTPPAPAGACDHVSLRHEAVRRRRQGRRRGLSRLPQPLPHVQRRSEAVAAPPGPLPVARGGALLGRKDISRRQGQDGQGQDVGQPGKGGCGEERHIPDGRSGDDEYFCVESRSTFHIQIGVLGVASLYRSKAASKTLGSSHTGKTSG